MIKVSIIIPVYNVQEYVCKCVESIINQTIEDIELIVIDDGSKDESIDIIRSFNDKRIKILSQSNKGLSAARNLGIENAKGEYILFVDSDDFIINKDAIKEMYDIIKKDKSDILVGNGILYFNENKKNEIFRDEKIFKPTKMDSNEFLILFLKNKCMYSGVCFNMYKKDIFDDHFRFKEGIYHEDEEFTPQAFLKARYISIYPKNFYAYRQRMESITKQKDNTKNTVDLIQTCLQLEKEFKKINNTRLKKLLKDNLVMLFLSTCYISRFNDIKTEHKLFLIRNSFTLKNFFKSLIFIINKELYYNLNDLLKNTKL